MTYLVATTRDGREHLFKSDAAYLAWKRHAGPHQLRTLTVTDQKAGNR